MAVELAEDYYLTNFKQLVRFVAESYRHLLTAEERAFAQQFFALPTDAQKLYVRLLCRSHSLFRQNKLHYSEILDLPAAAQKLCEAGYLSINSIDAIDLIVPLFTRVELRDRLPLAFNSSMKRAEMEEQIYSHKNPVQLMESLKYDENILEVQQQSHFDLYRLCFFGNLYQDMTDFVLRDLGLTKFEEYNISRANLSFQSREQIEAHLQYYACVEQLDDVLSDTEEAIFSLHKQVPTSLHSDANLRRRVDRLNNNLARQLERLGHLEAALEIYRKSLKPPSRERQARGLTSLGLPEEAFELCHQLLQSPVTEEESQFAEFFINKLAKKLGKERKATERYRPQEIKLQLESSTESVELCAANYFSNTGECHYTENTLFTAVLGLAIWDIIFAPVKGVFFNPFQDAPADFYEPEFTQQRQGILQDRLTELADTQLFERRVLETFDKKHGLQNPLVNWHYLSKSLLSMALQKVPTADWLSVFSRLLKDPRHNRNGFPDLIHFPSVGGYNLIEIKGPGDSLQKNQLRWMAYFAQHEIPHQVAHVSWVDAESVCT